MMMLVVAKLPGLGVTSGPALVPSLVYQIHRVHLTVELLLEVVPDGVLGRGPEEPSQEHLGVLLPLVGVSVTRDRPFHFNCLPGDDVSI